MTTAEIMQLPDAEAFEAIERAREQNVKKLDDVTKEVRSLKSSFAAFEEKNGRPVSKRTGSGITPGKAFTRSEQYMAFKSMPIPRGKVIAEVPCPLIPEQKALLSPTGGVNHTFAGVAAPLMLPTGALSLVSTLQISGGAVEFLRLTPSGAAGAQNPEGALKATMSITAADILEKVSTIAVWTQCSVQLLADAVGLEAAIDGILMAAVNLEADKELLVGTGASGGQLNGILTDIPAYDDSVNVAGDDLFAVLSHAILQLANKGIVATAAVVTPEAAELLRLAKNETGDYIGGFPSAQGNPTTWGIQIVPDAALVGSGSDFVIGSWSPAYLQLLVREDASVVLSLEDQDNFVKNLATLRAEMRAAVGLYNPNAFLKGVFTTGTTMRSEGNGKSAHSAPSASHAAVKPK